MAPSQHQPADRCKQVDVVLLIRKKWIFDELRQDELSNVAQTPRFPFDRLITPIGPDRPASEVLGHEPDHLAPVSVLAD